MSQPRVQISNTSFEWDARLASYISRCIHESDSDQYAAVETLLSPFRLPSSSLNDSICTLDLPPPVCHPTSMDDGFSSGTVLAVSVSLMAVSCFVCFLSSSQQLDPIRLNRVCTLRRGDSTSVSLVFPDLDVNSDSNHVLVYMGCLQEPTRISQKSAFRTVRDLCLHFDTALWTWSIRG